LVIGNNGLGNGFADVEEKLEEDVEVLGGLVSYCTHTK
jgi:hypothetical protein